MTQLLIKILTYFHYVNIIARHKAGIKAHDEIYPTVKVL